MGAMLGMQEDEGASTEQQLCVPEHNTDLSQMESSLTPVYKTCLYHLTLSHKHTCTLKLRWTSDSKHLNFAFFILGTAVQIYGSTSLPLRLRSTDFCELTSALLDAQWEK